MENIVTAAIRRRPGGRLRAIFLSSALLWAGSHGSAQVARSAPPADSVSGETFTNPLLPHGADPWVIRWKGFYYYTDTTGHNLSSS